MFIGHFAVAFAAKPAAPKASLGTLILAAQFLDGLWPLFVLAGVERVEIAPGDTAFTRILCIASSCAMVFISIDTPPFDAA